MTIAVIVGAVAPAAEPFSLPYPKHASPTHPIALTVSAMLLTLPSLSSACPKSITWPTHQTNPTTRHPLGQRRPPEALPSAAELLPSQLVEREPDPVLIRRFVMVCPGPLNNRSLSPFFFLVNASAYFESATWRP
jgi:hypothetical protein